MPFNEVGKFTHGLVIFVIVSFINQTKLVASDHTIENNTCRVASICNIAWVSKFWIPTTCGRICVFNIEGVSSRRVIR